MRSATCIASLPSLLTGVLLVGSVLLLGCTAQSSPDRSAPAPVADSAYLTSEVWNDGKAEVAFYRVRRTTDQYGRDNPQSFTVGTYLVKHRFSPETMTKVTDGSGMSSFKYALFYELESGSYQFKRNWVVNARQHDLRPLKQSFTSFDWCSNRYEEMAFSSAGPIEVRMRSDDYGNERRTVEAHGYPPAQIPLLVRGLDLSGGAQTFTVVTMSGTTVEATAELAGTEAVDTPTGTRQAERITVTYGAPIPSLIGEKSDPKEVYWRGTGAERVLVKWQGHSGRYTATLAEQLRTPYWRENLWTKLERVSARP